MNNPQLYHLTQWFDAIPIVRNEHTRLAITLLFPFERTSCIIKGEAGTGKTTIIRAATKIVWGDEVLKDGVRNVIFVGGTSDKGLLSDDIVGRITREATHCIIPEIQYIVNAPRNEDIIKAWTEGAYYPYSRAMAFGAETKRILLKPLPVLTALANENKRVKQGDLGEELERRLLPFYTESSKEMNVLVQRKKAEYEMMPKWATQGTAIGYETDLRNHMQQVITDTCTDLSPDIYNPCALYMENAIPKNFAISNTYITYWHKMVRAIVKFYYKEHPIYDEGGTQFYLATPADNYLAWLICGKAIEMASLQLKDIGPYLLKSIPRYQRDEEDYGHCSEDFGSTINEIIDKMTDEGYVRNKNQTKILLDQLEMAGYVKQSTKGYYYRTRDYDDVGSNIDFVKCADDAKTMVRINFPHVADDYIKTFCEDPVCLSPFVNEKIKLFDLVSKQKEEVKGKLEVKIKPKRKLALDDDWDV